MVKLSFFISRAESEFKTKNRRHPGGTYTLPTPKPQQFVQPIEESGWSRHRQQSDTSRKMNIKCDFTGDFRQKTKKKSINTVIPEEQFSIDDASGRTNSDSPGMSPDINMITTGGNIFFVFFSDAARKTPLK